MSAEELIHAVNKPVLARLAHMRGVAFAALTGATEEFIARRDAARALAGGIEGEVAAFRAELHQTYLDCTRALDAAFGGAALTPAPSPLDDEDKQP